MLFWFISCTSARSQRCFASQILGSVSLLTAIKTVMRMVLSLLSSRYSSALLVNTCCL